MSDQPVSAQPTEAAPFDFKPAAGPENASAPYLALDLPPFFVPRAEFNAMKRLLVERPAASLPPITLHGPSGSGKTSLAAALAHDADILERFPDGVLWASLRESDSVQHVQYLWGKALGDDLSSVPEPLSRAAALRTRLRGARALLVIDDVTRIEQINALNVGGPNCARVITTAAGDEVLTAYKTRRYAVRALSKDESLKLLAEWAGMLPSLYLPNVEEIVQRLSGSALSLALVGAQARQGITWLRLLEMLQEEQGPLAALETGDPAAQEKALALIVNLMLSRFGEFQLRRASLLTAFEPGTGAPFSAEAAAACWDIPAGEASEVLDTLVEGAIIRRMPGDRFALHAALVEPLRTRATRREHEAAAGRVRAYYARLVETTPPSSPGLDAALGQILAAFAAARIHDRPAAERFAEALMQFFEVRGLWADLVTLTRHLIGDARETGDVFREHIALGELGYAQTVVGDLDGARESYARSLTISRRLGDPAGEASALSNIGAICERQGAYDLALDYYTESLELREQLDIPEDTAQALLNVAGVLYWQERWDDALAVLQRALDLYTTLGSRSGQANTWLNIGAIYERMARDGDAEQAYQRASAIYANLDDEAGQALALNNLGIIAFGRGEMERALGHFRRSLALKEKLGDRLGQASTLNNIALLHERMGNPKLALQSFEQSHLLLDALGDPRAALVQENIDALRDGQPGD